MPSIPLPTFAQIFTDLQVSTAKEYNQLLSNTYALLETEQLDFSSFQSTLITLLLASKTGIPDKIIQFIQKLKTNQKFEVDLYDFLISVLNCKNKKIRKNSVLLLKFFEIYESELSLISELLFDKDKGVRKEVFKLLANHQDYSLNEKTKIISLYKDLVRYDPSPEVRKEAMKLVKLEPGKFNCVLSRCEDLSVAVRKSFFNEVFKNIKIKELEYEKRVFLLRRAFTEREFDAKSIFMEKIREEYSASELPLLNSNLFGCEFLVEILHSYFSTTKVEFENLEDFQCSSLLLEYLKFVENDLGRESLILMPISDFLNKVYEICCDSITDRSKIPTLKNLFKILNFYELYDFEVNKVVQSTVYKLLGKNFVVDVIDDCISLPNINIDTKFIGGLIYKNIETKNVLELCRSVMKIVKPLSEIHNAIMKEVLPLFIKDNECKELIYEIIFFYCVLECNFEYLQILIDDFANNYHLLTDLYLGGTETVRMFLKDQIYNFTLSNFNENIAVAACKLSLKDKTDAFIEKITNLYYTAQNNHTKQCISVFLQEFFGVNPNILVDNFCRILVLLPNNHRIWADQTLFWLEKCDQNLKGELIYKICVFLFKNSVFQKVLTNFMMDINEFGDDQLLIKKTVYCCGLLTKKGYDVSGLIGKLIGKDDGVPIDLIGVEAVKMDCGLV
jgi:hypothetical protein